jgi:hypothetical protein
MYINIVYIGLYFLYKKAGCRNAAQDVKIRAMEYTETEINPGVLRAAFQFLPGTGRGRLLS